MRRRVDEVVVRSMIINIKVVVIVVDMTIIVVVTRINVVVVVVTTIIQMVNKFIHHSNTTMFVLFDPSITFINCSKSISTHINRTNIMINNRITDVVVDITIVAEEGITMMAINSDSAFYM
jgi:hypothetical protein